ncbi:MAG: hypothetical protein LAT64_10920 [Phycisphaerales bacterium]|nr:hypothetical protein [Planctomycetota bacterium]MCH8509262.1 hypothetical protein [Phycisphaerales bacterium]
MDATRRARSDNATGEELARDMVSGLSALIDSLPESGRGPSAVARALGVGRVPISRMLGAIRREPGAEILAMLPGPETLRQIVNGAAKRGADELLVSRAAACVERFDATIRSFGTRAAFDATVSVREPGALERFEQAGRYQAFKGMGQVLGVEAETWLSTMILTPTPGRDIALDVTAVHGALGMRRLRPDITVSFTYGAPHEAVGTPGGSFDLAMDLSPYYTRDPAPLRSHERGGKVIHEFCPSEVGKHAVFDMLAGVHAPAHSKRFRDEKRTKRGVVVIPDVPVQTMIIDLLVGAGVFPGLEPELYLYNNVARGPADVEDAARFHDRITPSVRPEPIDPDDITLDNLPRYPEMLNRVCSRIGYNAGDLRGWRVRVPYPLYGFQWILAFEAPEAPTRD